MRVAPAGTRRSDAPAPPDDVPNGEDLRQAIYLAALGRRRLTVLLGSDEGTRRFLLADAAKRLTSERFLVLTVAATPGAQVEDLVETAGRSLSGDRNATFDRLLADLEARLDSAGLGLLMVENAERLSASTLRDLVDLTASTTVAGRYLQVLVAGGPELERRFDAAGLGPQVKRLGAIVRIPFPGATTPARSALQGAETSPSATPRPRSGRIVPALVAVTLIALTVTGVLLYLLAAPEAVTSPRGALAEPGTTNADAGTTIAEPAPAPEAIRPYLADPLAAHHPTPSDPETALADPPAAETLPPGTELPGFVPGAPSPTSSAVDATSERVRGLEERAERQIAARQLTTPADDNALQSLREIAAAAPGSPVIETLRERIVTTYRLWAATAERRGNWEDARTYYQRALRVEPDNREMGRLLANWDSRRKANRPATPPD